MTEPKRMRATELLRLGRRALKARQFKAAHEFLSEYCERMVQEDTAVSPSALASYALAVGYMGDVKEGVEICFKALSAERRNADVYSSLARLHLLADSRRRAFEALQRGLAIDPEHRDLLQLHEELGVRQSPAIPFLSRDAPVNVRLGKALRGRKRSDE